MADQVPEWIAELDRDRVSMGMSYRQLGAKSGVPHGSCYAIFRRDQFPKPETVDKLVAQLGDKDYEVRLAAAKSLGRIGPAAKKALPDLSKALADEAEAVQLAAGVALLRIDPSHTEPLAALFKLVRSTDSFIRVATLSALSELGPAARDAIPAVGEKKKQLRLHRVPVTKNAALAAS